MSATEEEGEIADAPVSYDTYNPEYAWDADADTAPVASTSSVPTAPLLRLVVLSSPVLPPTRRIAVLDAYTEIELGRDAPPPASTTPRVRLKELAVSKLHATIYWDAARASWAVVDMGSKHGTFVRAEASTSSGPGARLSAPRVASVPRALHHLDTLALGGTTFSVHIHPSRLACDDCALPASGDSTIPLFADADKAAAKAALKRKAAAEEASAGWKVDVGAKGARGALHSLRREMLARPGPGAGGGGAETAYVDRAAKRRQLHPGSAADSPGILPPPHTPNAPAPPLKVPLSAMRPPSPPRSAPAVPLAPSNVGHKLLLKQGWTPGSVLGADVAPGQEVGRRLVEPIQAEVLAARAGLGAARGYDRTLTPAERRWQNAQGG